MSMLSDIKNLLKKYLKNPIVIAAGAYILWRYINKQKKKNKEQWVSERIKILDDADDTPYSIIHDDRTGKYILIYNDRVFSADTEEELRGMLK